MDMFFVLFYFNVWCFDKYKFEGFYSDICSMIYVFCVIKVEIYVLYV